MVTSIILTTWDQLFFPKIDFYPVNPCLVKKKLNKLVLDAQEIALFLPMIGLYGLIELFCCVFVVEAFAKGPSLVTHGLSEPDIR